MITVFSFQFNTHNSTHCKFLIMYQWRFLEQTEIGNAVNCIFCFSDSARDRFLFHSMFFWFVSLGQVFSRLQSWSSKTSLTPFTISSSDLKGCCLATLSWISPQKAISNFKMQQHLRSATYCQGELTTGSLEPNYVLRNKTLNTPLELVCRELQAKNDEVWQHLRA